MRASHYELRFAFAQGAFCAAPIFFVEGGWLKLAGEQDRKLKH